MLTRREFLIGISGLLAGCAALGTEPDYTVVIGFQPSFEPGSLNVPRGTMVAWHNMGARVHTVTADPSKSQTPERVLLPSGVQPFDSGDLFAGDRWVYTFDTPGTYVYFCRYDEELGMIGSVTVSD
jgi:plastocyanin